MFSHSTTKQNGIEVSTFNFKTIWHIPTVVQLLMSAEKGGKKRVTRSHNISLLKVTFDSSLVRTHSNSYRLKNEQ